MKAADIAHWLGLEPGPRPGEWQGTRDGVVVGVLASPPRFVGRRTEEVAFFAHHDVPLRLGMLAQEHDVTQQLQSAIAHAAGPAMKDLGLERIHLRAADEPTARALLRHRHTREALEVGAPAGRVAIDDHRAWLLRLDPVGHDGARAILGWLIDLSRALLAARSIWQASYEPAIAATWSEVAVAHDLAFDPVRSMIAGHRRDVAIEARIDSEPSLLYTEIFLEWSSLDLGLHIDREAARGTRRAPADDLDLDALARAFNDDHRVRADDPRRLADRGIPADVMRAALALGAVGASLAIDDTGLVARVDRVLDHRDEIETLVRGAIRIAIGLAAPEAPRSAFR